MRVTGSKLNASRLTLLREACEFCADYLDIHEKYRNRIWVSVRKKGFTNPEINVDQEDWGYTLIPFYSGENSMKNGGIHVGLNHNRLNDSNSRKDDWLATLCHEFVHVKQCCDRRLYARTDGIVFGGELWDYDYINNLTSKEFYEKLPWEIEAVALQGTFYEKLKKEKSHIVKEL